MPKIITVQAVKVPPLQLFKPMRRPIRLARKLDYKEVINAPKPVLHRQTIKQKTKVNS